MIHWDKAVPPEVRFPVSAAVSSMLLPSWIRQLYVSYSEENGDVLADIESREEHGTATLTVYPSFLALSVEDQHRTVAHELAHAYLARLDGVVEDIVNVMGLGKSRQLAEAVYERAAEAVAEELAGVIGGRGNV